MANTETRPRARQDDLLIRNIEGGEIVVFDKERGRAHCLNPTVATVWSHCDGERTVGELGAILSRDLGAPEGEDLVWLALKELSTAHLLAEPLEAGVLAAGVTRRQAVATLGVGAAIAALLPVVTSIMAPKPAAAATCFTTGHSCTSGFQCCSGFCNGGTCA